MLIFHATLHQSMLVFFHPMKFGFTFTLGNLLSLGSTLFLIGPKRQLTMMLDPVRIYTTSFYLASPQHAIDSLSHRFIVLRSDMVQLELHPICKIHVSLLLPQPSFTLNYEPRIHTSHRPLTHTISTTASLHHQGPGTSISTAPQNPDIGVTSKLDFTTPHNSAGLPPFFSDPTPATTSSSTRG
ncbi:hypothetical protein V2J09_000124 [Rumex salicifolius]